MVNVLYVIPMCVRQPLFVYVMSVIMDHTKVGV